MRFYNFPYEAIEEALSNSVYHKSYERQSPIEIQVWPDKIEIISFPGPVPPVNHKVLKTKRRITARDYRNRRIGDFLKELQLTEGRGTGLPAIYDAMEANGSPKPVFETDDDCSYFLAVIPAHPLADKTYTETNLEAVIPLVFNDLTDVVRFANEVMVKNNSQVTNDITNDITNQVRDILNSEVHNRIQEMLMLLQRRLSRTELFEKMEITNQSFNRKKYLDPLLSFGWIEREFPEKQTTKQTYKISKSGKCILSLLNKA